MAHVPGVATLAVLRAIAEAFVPVIRHAQTDADEPAPSLELSDDAASDALHQAHAAVATQLAPRPSRELQLFLTLLSWRLGTLLLCGRHAVTRTFPFVHAFPDLPVAAQQHALLSWSSSRLADLRKAFKALRSIILLAVFTTYDKATSNPLWDAVAYPATSRNEPQQQYPPAVKAEAALEAAVLDLTPSDSRPPLVELLTQHGLLVSTGCKVHPSPWCACCGPLNANACSTPDTLQE
jgi:long-chain-alcohol oxidase